MWRSLLIIGGTGCGFQPVTAMSSPIDSAIGGEHDANRICTVTSASRGTPTATSLGGSGGNVVPELACALGELPIGLALQSTVGSRPEGGGAGERLVTAFSVPCGTITTRADGSFDVMPTTHVTWTANTCIGWTPFESTGVIPCPTNTVLVGISGNGGPTSLFNSVTMSCAPITVSGNLGSPVPAVPVEDTGSYTNNPESATCPTGTAIVGFELRGNCGVDEVTPLCAPLQCN